MKHRHPRVLFFAEAVTLAHVARPHVLANGLIDKGFDVVVASDSRYNHLFPDAKYRRVSVASVSSERFLSSLAKGSPLYDLKTLEQYVNDDLAVIDHVLPDAIIGDFRLSLSVSARLRSTRYCAITNSYWHPCSGLRPQVPELPFTHILGYRLATLGFRMASPLGYFVHSRAHNQLRDRYGIPRIKGDVRQAYVDGDQVLLADPPCGSGVLLDQPNCHYIGPLLWSPVVAEPEWWPAVQNVEAPVAYVTLGSSGDATLLPRVVEFLLDMGFVTVAATAGRISVPSRKGAFSADFLPGVEVARLADFVVCNGGSPASYQAFSTATPVLAIPDNLDQCLNSAWIETERLGGVIRKRQLSRSNFASSVARLTDNVDQSKLFRVSRQIQAVDSAQIVANILTS